MNNKGAKGRRNKAILTVAGFMACSYAVLNYIAKREKSTIEPLGNEEIQKQTVSASFYEKSIKRIIDKGLSFVGLIVLAPIYGIISLIIFIDDPGPVLFTQKRIGKEKKLFMLHKFRSMKMKTPHDVPTHQLENPDQYITKVGKFIRKYSLDELPQIWDIFVGNMSIIGPRPALWNQDDLVAERDKYGANDILPGLTGWAQINGRDELEIVDKAKLDGVYVEKLKQGGIKALFFDVKCFLGTIWSVVGGDGVVEGGTGELHKVLSETCREADAGFEDYGYRKHFDIDTSEVNQKHVLIAGAGSYIGTSFESWAKEHYPANFVVDTVDMRDSDWRKKDFSSYDVVFHVAGIAHADVGKVSEEEKKNYYMVNTDLAIETAQKAKAEGVRQFIFMSSMIIYGDSAPYGKEKVIDEHTVPVPANFYGDSKWQADKRVRELASNEFQVAVLRPPMIYGEGSKGNYPVLVKLAKKLPIFPNVDNCRSMLYIDNLCEFLCKLMLSGQGGVYFPQNKEYTKTSGMVKQIAETAGKKLWVTRLLKPAVVVGSHVPGKISRLVNKAFGNASYSQKISVYEGLDYQKTSLQESIRRADNTDVISNGKPSVSKGAILILVNHDVVIYNFRLELVERLLAEGYEVHISSPYGERIDDLIKLGAIYHEVDIDRHGMNPLKEVFLLWEYKKLMRIVQPLVVLGYTIKPNIYGALVAKTAGIPFIANITGLGSAVENPGWKQKAMIALYKISFTKVQRVFFQNEENQRFFEKYHIAVDKYALLPGSGVNLTRYPVMPLAECGNGKEGIPVKFAFISRIMKEKGIDQYLEAAEKVKQQYPATEFHVCGFCEEEYEGKLREMEADGVIKYHGMIRDVAGMMSSVHCIVHPTYYPEGLSNILLEACSCARAIITTNRAGCREVVENGRNGYMVTEKNVNDLIGAIKQFIELSQKEKIEMGLAGRKLVEEHYDRQIVVDRYMEEIGGI